jgi:hypothetical protein
MPTPDMVPRESQIVIKVPRHNLLAFKAACMLHGTTPTLELNRFIDEQTLLWQAEGQPAPHATPVQTPEGGW